MWQKDAALQIESEDTTRRKSYGDFQWPLFPTHSNETQVILQQVIENGTMPCYEKRTHTAHIFGLPKPEKGLPIQLSAGVVYDLLLVSFEESGKRRCAGGDFFETDLTSINWKSRPPIIDNLDGSYSLKIHVDPRFAGLYVFTVILLFGNLHSLEIGCPSWAREEVMTAVEIEFTWNHMDPQLSHPELLPDLRRCTADDFSLKAWGGRWSRTTWNRSCEINDDGRFICMDPREPCLSPWCEGPVGMLDSNGWVYSAHCKFKIFEESEAWNCLDGRWLFFWGDSNHEDTVRNLLNFVLGYPVRELDHIHRWFDGTFTYPKDKSLSVRISKIFNGHAEQYGNLHGLFCLQDKAYQEMIQSFFNGSSAPDTVVMNSGLHDAHYFKTVKDFAEEGVEYATKFWHAIWRHANPGAPRPAVIYRTTVAGAGHAREKFGHARNGIPNPHKMEVFNRVFVERLQELKLPSFKVVDAMDLTFPWHYDLNHSDGVHYGREPSKTLWRDGQIGHQYFVDLMLVHILLNAMCPS